VKILLVHNYYGSAAPSGENQVFEAERDLLRQRGHVISEFLRQSDELIHKRFSGALKGALATPWNPSTTKSMGRRFETFQPDVVHAHNTFPLISPSIFRKIGPRAAKVLTLHNYRLFCPAAIPMREGLPCTKCLDRNSVSPALRHGCYRNSHLATIPLAFSTFLHRLIGTWRSQVDAFITLSDFQRELMIKAGLPAELVHVKPNFFSGNPKPVPFSARNNQVVFAGRLTPEKGVESLINAWIAWGDDAPELRIIGGGPLRKILDKLVSKKASAEKVHFLGQVSSEVAKNEIRQAKLLVLPSKWFETFGLVVSEAFAFGTPAAVSKIGALPSIVQHGVNGLLFKPGDEYSLLSVVRKAWKSPNLLEHLANGARKSYEKLYTEDANYQTLMEIYNKAIKVNSERRQGRNTF